MCWIRTTNCWNIFRPWGDTFCWARETSSDTSWTFSSKFVCVAWHECAWFHRWFITDLSPLVRPFILGVIHLSLSLAFSQARVGEGCHHSLPTQSNRYPGDCCQGNQCPVWQSWDTKEAWCPATGGTEPNKQISDGKYHYIIMYHWMWIWCPVFSRFLLGTLVGTSSVWIIM